jgi:hypothetical protein
MLEVLPLTVPMKQVIHHVTQCFILPPPFRMKISCPWFKAFQYPKLQHTTTSEVVTQKAVALGDGTQTGKALLTLSGLSRLSYVRVLRFT